MSSEVKQYNPEFLDSAYASWGIRRMSLDLAEEKSCFDFDCLYIEYISE